MDNTFADLEDISLPNLEYTKNEYTNVLDGPFVVLHGENDPALGALLHMMNEAVYFLSASDHVRIGSNYKTEVDTEAQTITFSSGNAMPYTLKAIEDADMAFFYPELEFADLDEFKSFVLNIGINMLGQNASLTPFAVTAEGDEVLGLFRTETTEDDDESIFRRQDGNWVELTSESSDWDDIEDLTWINVLSGAIEVFDKLEDSEDQLLLDDLHAYVVS